MAREGLRTLVVAKKVLSDEQYADFEVNILKYCKVLCEKIYLWYLMALYDENDVNAYT